MKYDYHVYMPKDFPEFIHFDGLLHIYNNFCTVCNILIVISFLVSEPKYVVYFFCKHIKETNLPL